MQRTYLMTKGQHSYKMKDVEKLTNEAVELLRKLIAIPSITREEEEVCTFVSKYLHSKGIAHHRYYNNIVAKNKHYNSSKPTLMLCAHLDTVPPNKAYDFDCFNPDESKVAEIVSKLRGEQVDSSEVIGGLGSNDDGGSVSTMITVFEYFYDKNLPINLNLVLTAEEECSGKDGMARLWSEQLIQIDYAIIGEPTGMRAATSERGLLVIDAEAKGEAGHAARNEGVNSIYIALNDIDKIRAYSFEKVSETLGKVNVNVTQINAGTAHNVIPDKCNFVIDIRPNELYSNIEIVESLQSICQSSLKARNLKNRSSVTQKDSPLKELCYELGIETYSSPTTSDWMRIDCDAIKMGPGDSSRSHRVNEYILKNELNEAIKIYINFIENFAKKYEHTME